MQAGIVFLRAMVRIRYFYTPIHHDVVRTPGNSRPSESTGLRAQPITNGSERIWRCSALYQSESSPKPSQIWDVWAMGGLEQVAVIRFIPGAAEDSSGSM
jgi:hypothetical protein